MFRSVRSGFAHRGVSFLIRLFALVLAASFAWTHVSLAQSHESTAGVPAPPDAAQSNDRAAAEAHSLSGVVLDPSGAAIGQAQVILLSSRAVELARTTTDSLGRFRFDLPAPGEYRLFVRADNFRDATIPFRFGKTPPAPFRVSLQIFVQNQVVTVAGDAGAPQVGTDASQNQSANTVDREALDRVPVFDQDYVATLSRFLDDNATGTNGVTLVVNGMEANGPGVTPSAVQEVRINQNPYSALFSRPGRARLELITKGGTPQLHGTLNAMFRDSLFDARNAFALVKPPENREYLEGSLTGPLGRGKANSFLLALDEDLDNQQDIVDALTPSGALHENVAAPMHHFFGSTRWFHDFASGDQFWMGYSYEHRSFANDNVGGTVLPEAGYKNVFFEHEINFSYRRIVSPKLVNQLRFLVGHYNSPIISNNPGAQIIVSGAFTGGGAQADSRRTEYHFDGQDIVTYSSGRHTLNFGIDIPDISRRGMDDFTNQLGTYTFGSLADFEAGTPTQFLTQRGQGHLVFLETTVAGFIEDSVRLRPNLSFTLGVRYYWQRFFHDDPNNFAPRFSFAWAPTRESKTVFRGGAGIFFDRSGPRPIGDLLHFNGVNLLRFLLADPPYPVPSANLVGVPTSTVELNPSTRIPYSIQYSFGVERQVTAKSTFSATYVGSRGIDLFRSIDANAPLEGQTARPDPSLGQQRDMRSDGYQKSNAIELTFRGKPSKYFNGQVQYTLSKTYNNTMGITYFPASSFDAAADWARSDYDRRHKFDLLGSLQPTRLFTLGVALSLYSGRPVDVTTGSDDNHDGVINDRPLLGNSAEILPRNTLHGPGFVNLDVNIAHDFVLSHDQKTERTLTVALNSFNVLNHTNDMAFIGVCGAPNINLSGSPCPLSPNFGQAVGAQPPRRLQLNLEFKF